MPEFGISMGRIRRFIKEGGYPDDWEMFPCGEMGETISGIVILSPDRKFHAWIDRADGNKDVHAQWRTN